jgi:hypothetical protein
MLLKIQQSKYPIPHREPKLRVSSLPFCPLLFVLDSQEISSEVEFKSDFYFRLGTSIHELWQNAAAHVLPKSFIGDYACHKIIDEKTTDNSRTVTRCTRVVPFCSASHAKKQPCLHPDKVTREQCRASQHYQELEYQWHALTGHTDFLYKDKDGKYHLIDFKTTGTFLFDKPDYAISKGYYPSPKYKVQLETYVTLIERKYKIKIASYTIAYVSRDRAIDEAKKPALKLFTQDMTDKIRKARRDVTLLYIRQHKIAVKWLSASKVDREKTVNKLWKARPCHSKIDYLNKMRDAFFDDCPQLEKCLSGKLRKTFVKLAKQGS